MNRILLVDDEKDILELISLHLSNEGSEVLTLSNGLEVLETAAREKPQLIVLDIMLPGLDGWQVFRQLRTDVRTRGIPVLMLSARSQAHDRINGLELGADDYLTKPFSPRELVLRIKAILRRSQKVAMTDELRVGDFVVDRQNMVLTVSGQLAELTSTELKLVSFLMANPDVVHTRSELLNAVWGYADDTHSRTLDTHIKRLRDKLGSHGTHIGTVRKQGYLFIADPGKAKRA
ncbi:MAG: response regulator transcription factor [Verrucomicrobiaceae bacterium]|nr:response regulator transcription factor [Verrucomicrobiaceae bacterium]